MRAAESTLDVELAVDPGQAIELDVDARDRDQAQTMNPARTVVTRAPSSPARGRSIVQPMQDVSASHRTRLPTYAELVLVKRTFIGDSRVAMQLFVPAAKHVNIHPYALHLWACADGSPLHFASRSYRAAPAGEVRRG